jgi:hypothetical protein
MYLAGMRLNRMFVFGLVWLFSGAIGLPAQIPDSSNVIMKRIERLREFDFPTSKDSVIRKIPIAQSYLDYTRSFSVTSSTTKSDAFVVFLNQANAYFLNGMLKSALLMHMQEMESGILPVAESAVSHLDSAVVYYTEASELAGKNQRLALQADRHMAGAISDSLKQIVQTMNDAFQQSTTTFSVWRILGSTYSHQPETWHHNTSLSDWMYKSVSNWNLNRTRYGVFNEQNQKTTGNH